MSFEWFDVLIVGAGHAGAQAAIALRQNGFEGSIAVVGEEPELPYERPPLSKEYLSGDRSFEDVLIRPAAFWTDTRIAVRLGQPVTEIDPQSRTAQLRTGGSLGYSHLIWATGGNARRLSCRGGDLNGVHRVRTRADVDRLRTELSTASTVVVIGAGYIGLEAAAVLQKLGKMVTILEAQDRVLARVSGGILSRFYEAEHRAHGVHIRLGVTVECIEGKQGWAVGVRITTGELVPADLVIVGIGIVPAIEPMRAAGARCDNGILVDEYCRTSIPGIFAIGDCVLHPNAFARGQLVRVESVQNANDMATTVARVILGRPEPYRSLPWFWSNQFDLRLQTVGLSLGHDAEVLRGNPATRSFSIIYLKEGKVIALDSVNASKDYAQGRRLVAAAAMVDPAELEDTSRALKELVVDAPTGGAERYVGH